MNKITIKPREVTEAEKFEDIEFKNCTFITMYIDGISIEEGPQFDSGAVVWSELNKSKNESGKFLIFTCYCGIAEDAGWDYVSVEHGESTIVWEFEREVKSRYEFNKKELIQEIEACEQMLNCEQFPLAIKQVVFPNE